jgi:hypothetical protein
MKYIIAILLLACCLSVFSQPAYKFVIGSAGGSLQNGSTGIRFTLGESIVLSRPPSAGVQLKSGFWQVAANGYKSTAAILYRFIGNGSFLLAANWENGVVPPNPLPANAEIIIQPLGDGECILSTPYNVLPGGKVTVYQGKKFIITTSLTIQ